MRGKHTNGMYKTILESKGIKYPKKWLEANTDGVKKLQGTGIKPIQVTIDGKNSYYMTYAEAVYYMLTDKE